MSRIGNRPIEIPDNVTVRKDGGDITVSADGQELMYEIPHSVEVSVDDEAVTVSPADNSGHANAMWGTVASHINNMVVGVTEGYEKTLTYSGIGYDASVSGDQLNLEMGYSHDVNLDIPEGVTVDTEGDSITVSGASKEDVGQFAATVRAVREPEPYKGSGIQYEDETIRRKEGKTAV
jgi:large subunit ribosomal protein L6